MFPENHNCITDEDRANLERQIKAKEVWSVVILAADGEPEAAAWGEGPNITTAIHNAVTELLPLVMCGDLEDDETSDVTCYLNPVFCDVKGKAWDWEIESFDEERKLRVTVGRSGWVMSPT